MKEPRIISEIISEIYAIHGVTIQTQDDGELYKAEGSGNAIDCKRNIRTVCKSKRTSISRKRKIREKE